MTFGAFHKLTFGVGMAFSASCFTAIGVMVMLSGNLAPFAVMASFGVALFIIAAIAELASMYPTAIGVRTYVKVAFGDSFSLFVVFLYLSLILLVAGLEGRLFTQMLRQLWPFLDPHAIVCIVFLGLMAINMMGLEVSARVQSALVLVLAIGVAALSAAAFAMLQAPVAAPSGPAIETAAFAEAVVLGVFLFAGVEWVTVLQLKAPRDAKHVPRVLTASVICLGLLYVVVTAAILRGAESGVPPDYAMPQMALSQAILGQSGVAAVVGLTSAAILTTFNAGLVGAARLLYVLGREGRVPAWMALTSASGQPWAATIAVALLGMLSALIALHQARVGWYAEAGATIVCIVYAAFVAAAARLRRKQALRPRSFRAPMPSWMLWAAAAGLLALAGENIRRAVLAENAHGSVLLLMIAALGVAVLKLKSRAPQSLPATAFQNEE